MEQNMKMPDMYPKFFLMLGISFLIMYLVMFLNIADAEHFHLNVNRGYMALLMVAPMAMIMLLLMAHMYKDKKKNMVILIVSALVFVGALVALRSQAGIGDVQYMKAMIPHHSSAILTSRQATIEDPEVRKLADEIIKAQLEEIAEMETMLVRSNAANK